MDECYNCDGMIYYDYKRGSWSHQFNTTCNKPIPRYNIKKEEDTMVKNFFEKEKLIEYFQKLPDQDEIFDKRLIFSDKVCIITHDDYFDKEIFDYEQELGIESTFFLLTSDIKDIDERADLQLHYNKERISSLSEQIEEFKSTIGGYPNINRNHKLFWRTDHLELLNLAMNGIQVDSTKQGYSPFRLCVEGKLLPIWEVPFNISDYGYVSMSKNTHSVLNKTKDMETLFKNRISPITALFHPYLKEFSNWKDIYPLAEKYDYKLLSMEQFRRRYLND